MNNVVVLWERDLTLYSAVVSWAKLLSPDLPLALKRGKNMDMVSVFVFFLSWEVPSVGLVWEYGTVDEILGLSFSICFSSHPI